MKKEDLVLQINNNLSTREIALIYNIDQATVMYWLRKFKLKTNNVTEKIEGQKICQLCKVYFPKDEFYKGGKGRTAAYCKECVRKKNNTNRKLAKQNAIDYLGGQCSKCGYNKCNAALEFHHRNPKEKDRSYNNIRPVFTKKFKLELDKCVLLCANCHREEHHLSNY